MRGLACLDVDVIEYSRKIGLGKNLCVTRHDLTTFQRCQRKCLCSRYVFGCLVALMGAYGVTDMRHGFPRCK